MVRNAMSATEYYILNYLWSRETPGTFSEIMNYFNNEANKEWKKQTVNTFLTRLAQKGFLNIDKSGKRAIYIPAVTKQKYFENYAQQIVDEYNFERIVYLGSNTLKGTSQESALKMLELTAGRVVTMYDTPMGFRHGPKSIVDDTTLTVVYLSDEAYTRQYEVDLLKEMSGQRKGNKIVVVMSSADEAVSALADYTVVYDMKEENENILLGLDYILFAQTLAVLKSLSLDITPDNPCPTGEVNRVVKGVTLYPYTRK